MTDRPKAINWLVPEEVLRELASDDENLRAALVLGAALDDLSEEARQRHPDDLEKFEARHRRAQFLDLIGKHAPAVLNSLFDDVFPKWRDSGTEVGFTLLQDWAETFGLNATWIIDAAAGTLDIMPETGALNYFAERLRPLGSAKSFVVPWGTPALTALPNNFLVLPAIPGWNPALETRPEARDRLTREMKNFIEDHLRSIEEKLPAETKAYRGKDRVRHLRWLVLFQCRGLSRTMIKAKEHVSRSTLDYGLESAAEDMGLTLRYVPRGRPKMRNSA